MRILHTSDWHIGREFDGKPLELDQRAFIAWLVDVVSERAVDLVVVAGDIWDRSVPRQEAVTQLDDALNDLAATGAATILISGNHDNAPRLDWGSQRQKLGGIHIFASDERHPEPWVFERAGQRLGVVPVPYLDPQRFQDPVVAADGEPLTRTHEHVLAAALRVGRERLAELGPMPSMAVAHAYVGGSEISDSERHNVGGADVVRASVFEGFDYVALGHIHRPQEIGGNPAVAYSGSPLPYSYSEEAPKSVRLVELDATGFVGVEVIPIPVGRPVKVLTDSMLNLLNAPDYDRFKNHWISVKLTDEIIQEQPQDRLRHRFPHITSVAYAQRRSGGASGPSSGGVDITRRDPGEIVAEFFEDMQGRPANDVERDVVASALAAALQGVGA